MGRNYIPGQRYSKSIARKRIMKGPMAIQTKLKDFLASDLSESL